MDYLDYTATRELLLAIAERIIASKPLLTELDSAIGDGDHGIGMARGMEQAISALSLMTEGENCYKLFQEMGKTMLMSMGGASGVIFGTLFMGGAKGKKSKNQLDSSDFAELFRGGLEAIQKRGGAQLGDKTMIDALVPAVEAMEVQFQSGLEPMFQAACSAAEKGAQDTENYVAKFGRAKSLMERSLGHRDAGAVSTWIIFQAMYEYVCSH